MEFDVGGRIVWKPDPAAAAATHLGRFMGAHQIDTFEDLLARSATDPAWFTDAILHYLDIRFETPYAKVLDTSERTVRREWAFARAFLWKHLQDETNS